MDVDLLHLSVAELTKYHTGQSGLPVVPGGPPLAPIDLVHAQICLSDPDVVYSQCPNDYPHNAANSPYGFTLNPKVIPLLAQGLQNARDAGLKVILRFTYNWPCSTSSDQPEASAASTTCDRSGPDRDAPIDVILDHMRALAPVIQANSDIVYALQAGFIGQWGEWHDSTSGNDDKHVHNKFLDEFTRLFRPSVQLEVRRPYAILDYSRYVFGDTEDAHVVALGLGMHDDYFGSNVDDSQTFLPEASTDPDPTPYSTCILRHAAALVAQAYTMTGETSHTYDFSDRIPCNRHYAPKPKSYLEFAADYSLSTLQIRFAEEVWKDWIETGLYDTILASIGPHISLLSASFTSSGPETIRLTLNLQNTGWASIANSRPLWLYVDHAGSPVYAQPLPVDLKSIKPGSPSTIAFDVPMRDRLTSGTYGVYLFAPDPSPRLAGDARYALLLEDEDIGDPATGLNRILSVAVAP
ncbi:MAG: DUF4874 domain-containing protein [Acetobacteraceae bacterium]|nr:DUF4874 domain-containing protein [Acetobacteraceae bacterium]